MRLRRRGLIVIIVGAGLGLSLLGFWQSRRNEQNRLAAEFRHRAEMRAALTRESLENLQNALFGLSNLFTGSDRVTREEFGRAAQEVRARYRGITALEWVPVVPEGERSAVEAETARELGRPFAFTTVNADGHLVPAPAGAEHYPILYVEPLVDNERALGFDLAFGPTLNAIQYARDHRQLAVSQLIKLVQDPHSNRYGIVFIWPIFSIDRYLSHCIGFIQAVTRVDEILSHSPDTRPVNTLDTLYLNPAQPDPARQLIFYHLADPAFDPRPADPPTAAVMRAGLHFETKLQVGNQTWLALYRPSELWRHNQETGQPVWRLVAGLLVTGLLASLIHILGRRHEIIEQEVEDRTAELKESQRQLESIVQSVPGIVYRCTYEQQSKMLYVSDEAEKLTGYAAAELISGQVHIRDIIHPEDLSLVRNLTRESLQSRQPFSLEYRICPRGGREKWVLSRGRGVYDEEGHLRFLEGLVIDITDRKQAEADKLIIERRLLEGQKLESLGLLAGGVAHDFNNLLTSVMGNAGLARLDLPEYSSAAGNLQQIELAAQHAAEICQQMLAYAGKGRLTVEEINLSELLQAMKPLLESSINEPSQLKLDLADPLATVTADASQLRQIILNLTINAAEAIGDREGIVTLATAEEHITQAELDQCVTGRELASGRYVTMEVRDTGRGIPGTAIPQIFDPFYTTKFIGRGLGLAAVLGIVRGHNGALRVISQPGHGSTFKLMLPPAKPTPTGTPPRGDAGRSTVLLVDDDEPVRMVATELLRLMGYEAVAVGSGTEAIKLCAAQPQRYAFVMLDLVMPGLSGLATLEQLRAIRPNIRVLIMSGQGDIARQAAIPAGGPLAFISKPFDRSTLEATLRELLQ